MRFIVFFILTAMLVAGCVRKDSEETNTAEDCAKRFVEAFYNFEYKKAFGLCAQENDSWLRLYVSNLSEEDLKSIKTLTSRPEIDDCRIIVQNGDSAVVECSLHNVFVIDGIGSQGHMESDATVCVHLIKEKDEWRVRMAGLPRNEK
jgi:hypothetical protein